MSVKKGLDPFRVAPLLNVEEPVESLACEENSPYLYVGTAQGNVLQYEVSWREPAGEDAYSSSSAATVAPPRRLASVRLSAKHSVEQLRTSSGFVFALTADGVLNVLPGAIQSAGATVLSREVKNFCLHTGRDQQEGGSSGAPEVCVSLRKKLALFSHNGRAFEQRQEFPTVEPACALAWHSTWICVGFRREYSLYSDRAGVPREICHLDGKFSPQIAVVPGNELLLMMQENMGLFYNLSTQQPSRKSTVTWPRKVTSIGAASNYIFGSSGGGQVDVFSVRDQKNCQTLTVDGSTMTVCAAPGGRALIASQGGVITCLDPVPFARQVQLLLLQLPVRVNDALELLNANFGPEDPRRSEELGRFHMLAGWALFKELEFAKAFQHFTYSSCFQLPKVLSFWRRLLPGGVEHPALATAPSQGQKNDGAPIPTSLEEFVRERLRDRKPPEDSVQKAAAVVKVADTAMVSFLLRQREALLAQERQLPPEQRGTIAGGGSGPGLMLRAVDTAVVKLLVETADPDGRLQRLLDGGVRCTVEDCEAFLREKRREDVLAQLWKAQGLYDLVLNQWGAILRKGGSDSPPKERIVAEMVDALRTAAGSPRYAELLRRHVPQLLKADPSAVLQIFVGSGSGAAATPDRSLAVDEVLELLDGHSDLVRGYLENLVLKGREAAPRHRSQLGLIYLEQAAEERAASSGSHKVETGGKREAALRFLEDCEGLDARTLLPKAEEFGLHQERVVLLSKELDHERALRILVEDLNDLVRAEIYCRIAMARSALMDGFLVGVSGTRAGNIGGVNKGGGLDVSIFCPFAQLPVWAAPEVFRPRKGADEGDAELLPQAEGEGSSQDDLGWAALRRAERGLISGSTRPLMLLVRVLLGACAAAEKEPQHYPKASAEYRDATLSLLTAYAGHHELQPHEVVALLPSSWTLESLSAYLTKCTRISLHEKRAGMLEENLSSMAYLKTFEALAQERKRKVTINSTDACPVCNRRFVDKDSVGKAFVAYPNETCVHLQCKEDISICPKTGESFADNISVFCNALGTEPAD